MPSHFIVRGNCFVFVFRAIAAEGGRIRTYLHLRHLEKRLRTRHPHALASNFVSALA
jgi:hypothetical protein